MKAIWTLPLRSIRSSQFRSLRHSRVFLRPFLSTNTTSRAFSKEPDSGSEIPEMAPKFELKTPKGTKDCESLDLVSSGDRTIANEW